MKLSDLDPDARLMLQFQQGILVALVASRFDPADFERNLAAVRGTLTVADAMAPGNSEEEKMLDQMFRFYLGIFRAGDANFELPTA